MFWRNRRGSARGRLELPRRAVPDHVLSFQPSPGVEWYADQGHDLELGRIRRLAGGWAEAKGVDGGTPAEWAEETHRAARYVWEKLPASRIVDDAYYAKILPTLDRQLGLAGLRLARFLNDVQAPGQCAPR